MFFFLMSLSFHKIDCYKSEIASQSLKPPCEKELGLLLRIKSCG